MLIARIGDSVVGTCLCTPHPYPDVGVISTGDPMHVDISGPVARVGDIAVFSCGTAIIGTGTPNHISGMMMVARTGDTVSGCATGTIVSASINVSM